MNQLSLIGNLTRDPVLRHTTAGKAVCDLRVAVNGIKDGDVLYLDLATFDGQAEACARHLAKGQQIGFEGRLVYNEWTADDGGKRSKHSAIGRVQFLSKGQRSAEDIAADDAIAAFRETFPGSTEIPDEKIPF